MSEATAPDTLVTSPGHNSRQNSIPSPHPRSPQPRKPTLAPSPWAVKERALRRALERVPFPATHAHIPSTSGRRCSSTSTEPSSGVTKWHTGFLRFSKSAQGEGERNIVTVTETPEEAQSLHVLPSSSPWKHEISET